MKSRTVLWLVVLAVVVGLIIYFSRRRQESGGGGKLLNLSVLLYADGQNNCQQKLNGNPMAVIMLNTGDTVTFSAKSGTDGSGNNVPFDVEFPQPDGVCTSPNTPFHDATNPTMWQCTFATQSATSVRTGGVAGPQSTNFPYQSISINGTACTLPGGPGQFGMRLRP